MVAFMSAGVTFRKALALRYLTAGTGLTETEVAEELNDLLGLDGCDGCDDAYSRDRVHTIVEASKRRLRRAQEVARADVERPVDARTDLRCAS